MDFACGVLRSPAVRDRTKFFCVLWFSSSLSILGEKSSKEREDCFLEEVFRFVTFGIGRKSAVFELSLVVLETSF